MKIGESKLLEVSSMYLMAVKGNKTSIVNCHSHELSYENCGCPTNQTKRSYWITLRDKVLGSPVPFQKKLNVLSDQETVAKLTELDMVTADLERANSRVAAMERRNVSEFSTIPFIWLTSSRRNYCVRRLRLYGVEVRLQRSKAKTKHIGLLLIHFETELPHLSKRSPT